MISHERVRSIRWVIITGCVWLSLATANPPNFAAAQPRDENPEFPAAQESADSGAEIATDPQLKKNAVWLALMMWAGIIFGGVILLALVVMWGNRTRRLARSPLPPVAKRDELWFLKPKPTEDDSCETGGADSGSHTGP